jgi:hypothetical protein
MVPSMTEPDDKFDVPMFTVIVFVGVAILASAVNIGIWLDVEPGSLAEWVAGLSTWAALIAATYAAIQTGRTLRLERDRDRERDRIDRQRQAEQVAVFAGDLRWIGPLHTHTSVPGQSEMALTVGGGVGNPEYFKVTVLNASPMPVHDLTVEVHYGEPSDDSPPLVARAPIIDVTDGYAILGTKAHDLVTERFTTEIVAALEKIPNVRWDPPPLVLGWTFADNAGLWWRNSPGERLHEIPNPYRHPRHQS